MVFTCCCGGLIPRQDSAQPASGDNPEFLFESTIAILAPIEDTYKPLCAGAWISETQILTAKHCVMFFLRNDLYTLFEIPPDPQDVIGMTINFSTYQQRDKIFQVKSKIDQPFQAMVSAYDPEEDLAVLVVANPPPHQILPLAHDTFVGEDVRIVGHPAGLQYTFFHGEVSDPHRNMKYWMEDKKDHFVLHITSFVSPGNSGGPAVDPTGHLVGICSFIIPRANGASFFLPPQTIRDFLTREKIVWRE